MTTNMTQNASRTLIISVLAVVFCAAAPSRSGVFGGFAGISRGWSLMATASAQEHEAAAGEQSRESKSEESEPSEIWHWVNFAIIVGGIWFMSKKFLAP